MVPNDIKSRGLGDSVEKLIETTGINKIVTDTNKKRGKDCGCKKRKEWLNKKFPYRNKQ